MFISSNPSTSKRIFSENIIKDTHLNTVIDEVYQGFLINKSLDLVDREKYIKKVILQLNQNKQRLASLITTEVGKPITQSIAEIEKCIVLCEHYIDHAQIYLSDQVVETEHQTSKICFQPLGVIVGVMPWNFPFWQVFRFVIPTILSGNTVLIKHAPNVGMCANALSDIFNFCGLGNMYKNIFISVEQFSQVVNHNYVKGVSLTGSSKAGALVGALAGSNIKPQLLELGGSDVFIVNDTIDLDAVVSQAISARLQNNGQSCIASKRFLIKEELIDRFMTLLIEKLSNVKIGDPSDVSTAVGPLARQDLKDEFETLLHKGEKQGARLVYKKEHNQNEGFFTNISVYQVTETNNCLMQEEVFGPAFVVKSFFNIQEAIDVANDSSFGLSSCIWTDDENVKNKCVEELEAGAVFINQISRSDARLPFGGVKDSGVGRELGEEGIKAFVNKKLIVE